MRKKRGPITLLLAFVLCAATASPAAALYSFTAPGAGAGQTTYLTGERAKNAVFQLPGGEVTCTSVTFTGTTSGPSSSQLTLTPSYSSCTAFGFSAHVKMNGCDFLYTTPWSFGFGTYTGDPPHIQCPAGSAIELTPTTFGVSVCTAKIGAQRATGGHTVYINGATSGAEMRFDIKDWWEGLHYVGTGGTCGSNVTNTNAIYTGEVKLRGYSDAFHTKQFGITVD